MGGENVEITVPAKPVVIGRVFLTVEASVESQRLTVPLRWNFSIVRVGWSVWSLGRALVIRTGSAMFYG